MQIYLARNNQQAGPYTLEQLNQMLASQQVQLTDLVWHQGMSEWKALGELTQGQHVYMPEGYTPPVPSTPFEPKQNTATQNYASARTQQNEQYTLASIPKRVLAKIVDLLLWIPATFILTAFFNTVEKSKFASLNEQFMQAVMTPNADPNVLQTLQTQMVDMFPNQAWIAMFAYLFIMLFIQAFLIAKSGQSIGKKITKIKIVDVETGEQVNLMRGFTLRSVLFIFLNFLSMPLSVIIDSVFIFSKKRQTLHDKLAKTKVINQ
ncbi:RDD family protein [Acinetobacter sp. ANC 5054]|uniref:RDD family protein n=1 Tax=Acinetobacter sp. ANC 5054 TaxID=1977877 RepID=UPI000A34D67C|nr:RDD family protein [Acinetobacter sp. ANC 5054]OTG81916.1 RDD family protein [Acinetobacter sp. ANC 5054]